MYIFYCIYCGCIQDLNNSFIYNLWRQGSVLLRLHTFGCLIHVHVFSFLVEFLYYSCMCLRGHFIWKSFIRRVRLHKKKFLKFYYILRIQYVVHQHFHFPAPSCKGFYAAFTLSLDSPLCYCFHFRRNVKNTKKCSILLGTLRNKGLWLIWYNVANMLYKNFVK